MCSVASLSLNPLERINKMHNGCGFDLNSGTLRNEDFSQSFAAMKI